jgi:glycosyltransferase involved in cell wall biosynthesis
MTIKDTKILVIAANYSYFIKELVEAESKYVKKINVLVHHNHLAQLSKYLPFEGYIKVVRQFYLKENIIDVEEKPDNVKVDLLSFLYLIPDGRNKNFGNKIAEKFEGYIKKYRIEFDIIHAHFIYPQGYVAVKLGKKFNKPVIITAHGHDIYDMPFRDNKWYKKIKWILDESNHVITVSEKNRRILVEKLKIRDKKITVIPNGFNSQKFNNISQKESREKIKFFENKKIILCIANQNPIKGQEYLIKAMKMVVEKRQDVICFIIGGGSLTKEFDRLINKLNLKNYIKILGLKQHKEIPLWMNSADLFVLPSLNEGNPTVMFEALGTGLPFIGSNVGGIPEIITSEDYGLLVEPANSKNLAEKIIIALNKKWEKDLIRKYAQQFSWDDIARQTLDIYELVKNNYINNLKNSKEST